ncbi:LysE family translocator [Siccirubricoccus sp. KC 17139]|uniref:LysE family translocator n=1 Tax=Siccirubricoccus soli TaxID=2899147 RepID=A0ABT1D5N9_9PROT|nr:LysE family translocator [Siccirubricoccus soli]MCO6417243.1 LysE family translocator [Siccirubricoccus soli]MCP2683378.1 LysE family translocator [Siccirubricoccus soli]
MDAAWLAAATGFAFAMSATPGPNNAMVAASGARFGLRRTLPHMLGVSLGFPVMLVLVALGAAELLRHSATLQGLLRWAGAAWMLWLAWGLLTAAPAAPAATTDGARPMRLWQAALFQWVNPKAWIIAAGAIATYTGSHLGVLPDALLLAAIFAPAAFLSLLVWAAMGQGAARLLSPRGLVWFNRAMAGLLLLSLVPLLLG